MNGVEMHDGKTTKKKRKFFFWRGRQLLHWSWCSGEKESILNRGIPCIPKWSSWACSCRIYQARTHNGPSSNSLKTCRKVAHTPFPRSCCSLSANPQLHREAFREADYHCGLRMSCVSQPWKPQRHYGHVEGSLVRGFGRRVSNALDGTETRK